MLTAQTHYKHNNNAHLYILQAAVRKGKLHTTPCMDTSIAGVRNEIILYRNKPNRIQQYVVDTTTTTMFQYRTEPKN